MRVAIDLESDAAAWPWHLVLGTWYLMYDIWYLVSGVWCLVSGIWPGLGWAIHLVLISRRARFLI